MPHLIMEFSNNLGDADTLAPLLEELHDIVGTAESVDIETLKSRLYPHAHYFVGADTSRRAFLHVTLKILPGRTLAWQKTVGEKLHGAAKRWVTRANSGVNCSTTVEFMELSEASYFRTPPPQK